MNAQALTAPFPYFGGKRRVAGEVWARLGDVPNYIEPFAGSLAVLLARPYAPKVETVNDLDCHVVNFWRALKAEPDRLAVLADWPMSEPDLAARHRAKCDGANELRSRIYADADYYDVKAAAWWMWGACASIASAWHRETPQTPAIYGHGTRNGNGYFSWPEPDRVLSLLSDRLRRVRILCGDWRRAVTPVRIGVGLTGILLDPPYDEHEAVYEGTGYRRGTVSLFSNQQGYPPLG